MDWLNRQLERDREARAEQETEARLTTLDKLLENAGVARGAEPEALAEIKARVHQYASELATNARITYDSAAEIIVAQLRDLVFRPDDPQALIQERMERLQITENPATGIAEVREGPPPPRREAYPVRNKYAGGRPPGRR